VGPVLIGCFGVNPPPDQGAWLEAADGRRRLAAKPFATSASALIEKAGGSLWLCFTAIPSFC
jgi:hypothetical protein